MILITGGAGFVGSSIAIYLKKLISQSNITVLDNLKRRGSELNLIRLKKNKINFIHGDIRNTEDLKFKKNKISTIIECSAEPSVLAGTSDELAYLFNTNLTGTINCLNLAKQHNSNFIFLSSNRVYPYTEINKIKFFESENRFILKENQKISGFSLNGIDESFSLNGLKSFYGATKLSSELIIQEYSKSYKIKSIINRCGVIAGPWQMGKIDQGIFAYWMLQYFYKNKLSYFNFGSKGKQVRDVIHINDLCKLIFNQITLIKKKNGNTYNVGGGIVSNISLKETSKICSEITGNKLRIAKSKIKRINDIRIYISNTNKVQKDFNWSISYKPKKILYDIFLWIKKNEIILKNNIF